jgi:hypothetical protein
LIQAPLFSQESSEVNNQNANLETDNGNTGKSEYYTLKRNLTYGTIFASFAATIYMVQMPGTGAAQITGGAMKGGSEPILIQAV